MVYSTLEVAAALGASPKRVDNLMSRSAKHLIASGARGKSRELEESQVEILAIALLLNRDLGTPLGRSIELAVRIASSHADGIAIGTLGVFRFDVTGLRRVLRHALADVVEDSRPARRGRPPRKARRGASL